MKLLLAVDGSGFSETAIRELARIPFRETPEVHVLTVMDRNLRDDAAWGEDRDRRRVHQDLLEEAERVVDFGVEAVGELGYPTRPMVREGHVGETILAVADEIGADLLVAGSHGHGGLRRFFLGSVSTHLVNCARCPVLIARRGPEEIDGQERVLFATDGSASARGVAREFAAVTPDRWTDITVLRVIPLVTFFRMDLQQRLSAGWPRKRESAARDCEEAAALLERPASHIETELAESGDVSQAIIDRAKTIGARLIVMGRRGNSHNRETLLGSVYMRVVHHAPCSVWVGRE